MILARNARHRFMRQDFFTYSPQFKLLIAGNHKPGLQSVEEAMRRRLNLIPSAACRLDVVVAEPVSELHADACRSRCRWRSSSSHKAGGIRSARLHRASAFELPRFTNPLRMSIFLCDDRRSLPSPSTCRICHAGRLLDTAGKRRLIRASDHDRPRTTRGTRLVAAPPPREFA